MYANANAVGNAGVKEPSRRNDLSKFRKCFGKKEE